jgi:pyruvate/2-oxoglutarate dehydrogenase complex dihydrolipoamide dehydrogenase (E3) component
VFDDEHTMMVDDLRLDGKAIVIATGSKDFIPDIPGLDQVHFWHWYDALSKKRQPKALAIIGGGPAACEIATFYATFGTRIVLIQRNARLLSREDEECARFVEERLRAMGVDVVTGASVSNIVDGRGGVYGVYTDVQGIKTMHAVEQIVVATGKRSCVNGFEAASLKLDASGTVVVSKEQQTNKKHIFAAGDVCGGLMLTSTAQHEGFIAGYNAALVALNKRSKKMFLDERVAPRVTFVEPEFASVGVTAENVKTRFGSVLVGRAEMQSLGRSIADHAPKGIVKLVAHPKTRKILGGSIIGPHAGEMIHEVSLALYANLSIDKLAEMIHAFPTYSEAVRDAASQLTLE